MKVLLVKPPEPQKQVDVVGSRITLHLGLGYIASNLRKNGIDVEILDARINELDMKQLEFEILQKEFDMLGISVPYQWSIPEVLDLIRNLKNDYMDKPLVIGGHPPTFYYEKLLRDEKGIDFVSTGEGEYSILELAIAIRDKKPFDTIKGVAYRQGEEVVFNGYRELIANLDELPFPDRDGIVKVLDIEPNLAIPISGSRGCSWASCSFCDIQSFYKMLPGKNWRGRSPKSIADEIEMLVKKYSHNIFSFVDDDFFGPMTLRKERIYGLCDEIEKRNLDIKFSILCNVRDVEEKMFLRLKKAGLYRLFLGVESGVQRVLDTFNKGILADQSKNAIVEIQRLGIGCECGSIFVDPYSTISEIKENVDFWDSVKMMSMDQYRDLIIFKGTPLEKKIINQDIAYESDYDFVYEKSLDPDVLKLNRIVDIIRKEYMYPNLGKLRRTRLRVRKISERHNLMCTEVEKILAKIGDLHFNWFSDVFTHVFKRVLDDIKEIDMEDIEIVLLGYFRKHLKEYNAQYNDIQESFENFLDRMNVPKPNKADAKNIGMAL